MSAITFDTYLRAYIILTKKQREATRRLFHAEIKRRKGEYSKVFLSKKKISRFCKSCKKTIQRFNSSVKDWLFLIEPRFDERGRQTTNSYWMDKTFFDAMVFLDKNNLLYKSKEFILKFVNNQFPIEEMKMSPTPPENVPPIVQSLSQEEKETYGYVHAHIAKIGGLTRKDQVLLSRYPEHAIVAGVEDVLWWWRQGNRPDKSLAAVLTQRIKDNIK